MENKPITLPSGSYAVIDVPETSMNHIIDGNMRIVYRFDNGEWEQKVVPELMGGQWQLIGKGNGSEITETDWRRIVEYANNVTRGYVDYGSVAKSFLFATALESGHSWIKSMGKEPSKVCLLKQLK